jgi:hypothetical protein
MDIIIKYGASVGGNFKEFVQSPVIMKIFCRCENNLQARLDFVLRNSDYTGELLRFMKKTGLLIQGKSRAKSAKQLFF